MMFYIVWFWVTLGIIPALILWIITLIVAYKKVEKESLNIMEMVLEMVFHPSRVQQEKIMKRIRQEPEYINPDGRKQKEVR